jgi:hypothetical protein
LITFVPNGKMKLAKTLRVADHVDCGNAAAVDGALEDQRQSPTWRDDSQGAPLADHARDAAAEVNTRVLGDRDRAVSAGVGPSSHSTGPVRRVTDLVGTTVVADLMPRQEQWQLSGPPLSGPPVHPHLPPSARTALSCR